MLIKTYLAWGFAVLTGFAILGSTGIRVPRLSTGMGAGGSSYSSPGYYGGHGSGGYGGSSGFGWGK